MQKNKREPRPIIINGKEYKFYKKCYEYTPFSWYDVDYRSYDDNIWSETIFAETAGEARYKAFMRSECDDKQYFLRIKVRRSKSGDLLLGPTHPGFEKLSKEQIDKMKHAVGFDNHHPFYRNHYQIEHEEDFEDLISKGLAFKEQRNNQNYYVISKLGGEMLSSLMPIARSRLNLE